MKKIIQTSLVESNRSTFVIDLVKHNDKFLYVEISQTIATDKDIPRSLKIHSNLLPKLLSVLQHYEAKMRHSRGKASGLTELDYERFQTYYFKGVSIKEMSALFNQPEELIEDSLRDRGIKIVPLSPPKFYWRRTRNKRL